MLSYHQMVITISHRLEESGSFPPFFVFGLKCMRKMKYILDHNTRRALIATINNVACALKYCSDFMARPGRRFRRTFEPEWRS